MKLTLIRHGLTEGNIKKLYYGSTDLPLLPEGIRELERLNKEFKYPTAELYCTSGMLRTEQTLFTLYGNIAHTIIPELKEIDFGDFEMRSYDQLKDDPEYIKWISGDFEKNTCPNGESGEFVTKRAVNALDKVIASDIDTVIVTHGGVIGGVMMHYFNGQGSRYDFTPEPGYGFTIEFENHMAIEYKMIPTARR